MGILPGRLKEESLTFLANTDNVHAVVVAEAAWLGKSEGAYLAIGKEQEPIHLNPILT